MIDVAVALAPVLAFLALLVFLDSFKLVTARSVLAALAAGAVTALLLADVNLRLIDLLEVRPAAYSRYVAPLVEELGKALWVVFLIRTARVGFLVDAAVLGFAVGAGFAVVENVEYLQALIGQGILLWVVRGFGTAVLHGGLTAVFALVSKGLSDRHPDRVLAPFLPGLLLAVLVHSLFNHSVLPPLATTMLLLLGLPILLVAVFERSERATREWLGLGLDAEVELLSLILGGGVSETRVGAYLQSLRTRLPGTVVADMLCLLRIHLELSIRAKGLLLAREAGVRIQVGDDVRASFEELRYLERAIGRTGKLAIEPVLKRSRRDLWQLYRLRG